MTQNGYITFRGVTVQQFEDAMEKLRMATENFGHAVVIGGDEFRYVTNDDWRYIQDRLIMVRTRQEARHATCVMEVGE